MFQSPVFLLTFCFLRRCGEVQDGGNAGGVRLRVATPLLINTNCTAIAKYVLNSIVVVCFCLATPLNRRGAAARYAPGVLTIQALHRGGGGTAGVPGSAIGRISPSLKVAR